MTVKVPCGRTLGHGESCEEGYLCEQCAEIARLQAESAHLKDELADWRKEGEKLRAIERAAEKAYRYHMLGYKEPTEFNANVMLDLMNELGAVL